LDPAVQNKAFWGRDKGKGGREEKAGALEVKRAIGDKLLIVDGGLEIGGGGI